MAISSQFRRRSSDIVLLVAGFLLVGLLVVPAMLPSASAQSEGGPTTTSTTSTTGAPTTTAASTTTTETTTTTTTVPASPRPDAQIRRSGSGLFAGNEIYNTSGANQSRTTEAEPGDTVAFDVRVENDSTGPQDIRVFGTAGTGAFTVRFFNGSNNATPPVTSTGGYTLQDVAAGGHVDLRVEIVVRNGAAPGTQRKVYIRTRPAVGNAPADVVVATAKRPLFSAEQRRIAELVNDSRRGAGRAGVTLHRQLTSKAQAWAEHLARINRLDHSRLTAGVPAGWRALAENVGYGSTIAVVHTAFMNSSGHRTNILGPYNFIGTGYAEGHGQVWVVHVFMRR